MVLEGNNLPSTVVVSFTKSDSHWFNISPLLHSSKCLGLPCFSRQSHQDWKLRIAQIVLFSVLFGTNPFDIVFNSKSDVNLFPNLLVTSLIAFLFFAAGTSSPIHSAIPPSLNMYSSFGIFTRSKFSALLSITPRPTDRRLEMSSSKKSSPSHEKSVSGETLPAAISLLRLEMYTVWSPEKLFALATTLQIWRQMP